MQVMNGSTSDTRPIDKNEGPRASFRPAGSPRPFGWWAARQSGCGAPAKD